MNYNGKWYEECEMTAYVKQLERERDVYKEELKSWLRKACECISGDDFDCNICPYNDIDKYYVCPSKLSTYAAKLRLEELK